MIRFAIIFALLAACGGKSDESSPTPAASGSAPGSANPAVGSGSGSAEAKAGSGSGSAVAAVPKDPDPPTVEDFEEESITRITEKNVDTEVKTIEKDIGDN